MMFPVEAKVWIKTYSTTLGAIILQGPHHVAKQSRTRRPFSVRALSHSVFLCKLLLSACAFVKLCQNVLGEIVDAAILSIFGRHGV
jgi:hypothetical protein